MKKVILLLLFSVVFVVSALAQQRTITGTVTDENTGEPLQGVAVVVQGTTIGVSTDIDGEYTIRVPQARNILVFSFVGFVSVNETIGDRGVINVQMSADLQLLDEVVVVGYGTLSRRQLSSSIGSVSSRDIEDVSFSTAESAIQGRVSGVQFTGNSGLVGGANTIRIRGASSITASTTPLIVVDGVPITNPTTSGSSAVGAGLGGGTGLNPLINLNPADIESYEVLKDAAAAAIYGSRGSNGVILITTKRGRANQQQISIRSFVGFVQETNRLDMMTGDEFTRIWNDATTNRFGANHPFMLATDNIVNTDWMDAVTQTGVLSETQASIAGGTERTTYRLSGTYRFEEGYIESNEMNRYNARLRIDHKVSDAVEVGLTLNPSRTDNFRIFQENAVAAPYTFAGLYYPNTPIRLDDGSFNFGVAPNPIQVFTGQPVANLEGVDAETNITQILGSANINWNVNQNFLFNSQFSFDTFQLLEQIKRASFTTDGFPDGVATSLSDQFRNYNWTNTVEYRNTFGNHNINAVGGVTVQASQRKSFNATARAFPNDQLKNISSAADITGAGGTGTDFSFLGYLGRVNYTFKDRYIVTATARYDGSSRFSDENRFGFFPAVSGAWIVSDENFFRPLDNKIDFLKVRASIGRTGNSEIGNFPTLGLVGFGADYNGVPGGRLTQLANPGLLWEKTTQFDTALEFGFLRNRIRGSVGYYHKSTEDLLLNVQISRVNGFSSFTDNVGEVENQGFEFELAADIFQGSFNWTVSANVSTIQNEVKKLVGGEDQIFGRNMLREGEALGQFFLVRYAGVNPENGNAQYLDVDGEITESFSLANRVVTGNPFPDFFGGVTNNFSWKGFDATAFFQFSYGNDIYRADGGFTDTNLSSLFNQASRQSNYWTPENRDTNIPQPRLLLNNGAQASTRYLEDASYLRLKVATLGYTLPASLSGSTRVRVYAQGQNLFTVTSSDFNGSDPEAASGGNIQSTDVFFALPQSRTFMFGVNITL
jgi:TonB-linked SusC/RagA family outer membrane protein